MMPPMGAILRVAFLHPSKCTKYFLLSKIGVLDRYYS